MYKKVELHLEDEGFGFVGFEMDGWFVFYQGKKRIVCWFGFILCCLIDVDFYVFIHLRLVVSFH